MNFEKRIEKQKIREEYWKKYRKELWSIRLPIWLAWMLFFVSSLTDYSFRMVCIITFFIVSGLFFWKLLKDLYK